jgi:hypothetical protein
LHGFKIIYNFSWNYAFINYNFRFFHYIYNDVLIKTERTMAKNLQKEKARAVRKPKAREARAWEFPLNKKNLQILGIGIIVILIGFGLMATGITDDAAVPDGTWNNPFAVSVAPILLLIGYCVIIPYGILKYFKGNESDSSN